MYLLFWYRFDISNLNIKTQKMLYLFYWKIFFNLKRTWIYSLIYKIKLKVSNSETFNYFSLISQLLPIMFWNRIFTSIQTNLTSKTSVKLNMVKSIYRTVRRFDVQNFVFYTGFILGALCFILMTCEAYYILSQQNWYALRV